MIIKSAVGFYSTPLLSSVRLIIKQIQNVLLTLAKSDFPKPVDLNYGAHMLVRVRCDNGLEGIGEEYFGTENP